MQGYSPPVERTLMDGQNSRLPEQVSKSAELVHTARHSTLHTAQHSTQHTAHCTLHTAHCTPRSLCTIFNSWWRQGSILRLSKSPSQHIPTHAGGVCKSLLDRQHCRLFPFGNVIGIILECKKKKLLY